MKFRIHRVTPAYIREMRADGYALQSPGDAVDIAIHGPRWRKKG